MLMKVGLLLTCSVQLNTLKTEFVLLLSFLFYFYFLFLVHAGLYFHNPPNSGLVYRIINVRTSSFCMASVYSLLRRTFVVCEEFWLRTNLGVGGRRAYHVKPVLNWANVCSPNILRTLRRTMIRFLIELLVRRIWFGQSKLYFVLNWLVMRCKLRPELAADAQQTAWSKM